MGDCNTLREEILAERKFGGFGGFCEKTPNETFFVNRQIKFPPNLIFTQRDEVSARVSIEHVHNTSFILFSHFWVLLVI